MAGTEIVAEPGVPQVIVRREFATTPQVLFRAHTEPDLLARWLGPPELPVTVDRLEPRDAGRWRYTQVDAHGRPYSFHGLFHGDPSPEQIVQTYEFDRRPGVVYLNIITFEPRGRRTLLRQNTVFPSVEDRDLYVRTGMERGLRDSHAQLDTLIATLTAPGKD